MSSLNKMVACQLSYLPLRIDNIEEKVEEILNVIKNSGLEFKVGSFATEIKGSKASLFSLIKDIFEVAEAEGQFMMELKLSNVCGC